MRYGGRWLVAVCLVLCSAVLGAQERTSISGTVTDTSRAVLPGVSVTATSSSDGRQVTARTDGLGRYQISGLAPGTYVLRVELSGFAVTTRTIQTGIGLTATVDFTLGDGGPPPPPPPPLPPRYRVAVDGLSAGTVNHVVSRATVTARFWIAPTNMPAQQDLGNWAVNPILLREHGRIALTVFMNCTMCAGTVQDAPLTYNSDTRRSNEVSFRFAPDRELADADGTGHLEFTVLKAGQLLDKVVATIVVETSRSGDADASAQADSLLDGPTPASTDVVAFDQEQELQTLGNKTASVQTDPAFDADFMFVFKHSTSASGTDLEIAAVSQRARDIIKPDTWKTFVAGVDREEIDVEASRIYLVLKDLITTHPDASALLKTLQVGLPLWDDAVHDKLSDSDYKKALDGLGMSSTLYNAIFNEDKGLSTVVARIEHASVAKNRPLRILIVTNGLVCPWTVLHAPGTTKAEDFWGFKYELAVLFLPGQGAVAAASAPPTPLPVHYVAVPDDADRASIGGMAAEEYAHLNGIAGIKLGSSRSKVGFLQALKAEHASMRLVYAFIHGSDGTLVEPDPINPIVVRKQVGSKLMFKLGDSNEVVTPSAIKDVKSQLGIGYGDLLDSHPVIVLNACELGAAGYGVMTNGGAANGFPDTFLKLGAGGVVAADAPLWALFALRFGDALMTDMLKGTNLPTAVRNARFAELKRDHNPLGLLYSFYGPMNVHVK